MPPEELTYRDGVKKDLSEIKSDQQEIKKMVAYTNGKVRKLIIAMVAVAFLAIGMGINNGSMLLKLFGTFL